MTNESIRQAAEALRLEKTLLYPTDTIWGIGCDATNSAAIEKIYAIKQREHSKSMLILCADIEMLRHYVANPSEEALQLATESEKPTTVIFPQAKNLPDNLTASDGSIGIRIPKMEFCRQLLREFGKPIVSTSANLSGEPSPIDFDHISDTLKKRIDHIVEDRPEYNRNVLSSRILKVTPEGKTTTIRG